MKYAKKHGRVYTKFVNKLIVTNSPHLQNQHHTWENSSTHKCIATCGKQPS